MPTLLLLNGFRFFFYSNESNEPIHVHVTKGNADGKVWLTPNIEIAYMHYFTSNEIKELMKIITANATTFKTKWNEFFTK